MTIVIWNVRGLNREEAVRQTKLLIKYHKPDLLFLMETKLAKGKANTICSRPGSDHRKNWTRRGNNGSLKREC